MSFWFLLRVLCCCCVARVVSCVVLFLLCVCVCDLFLLLTGAPLNRDLLRSTARQTVSSFRCPTYISRVPHPSLDPPRPNPYHATLAYWHLSPPPPPSCSHIFCSKASYTSSSRCRRTYTSPVPYPILNCPLPNPDHPSLEFQKLHPS